MANGKLRRPMRTLGMQMRNFGRNLMRFYFGSRQAADQPPALPPPSWQRHTDTPLDWAASGDQAAENVETSQYVASDTLTFPSEPLAGRPTPRPQRSQPQIPPAAPSAASPAPVQRTSQAASPPAAQGTRATAGTPAAPPPKPRTAAQMSDDERLTNIMEFHRQREREQQRMHEERLQRMKAQPPVGADDTTPAEGEAPMPPRRRRGASFEYIETSTLRSGEDDAPAASGTAETAIQRQEREVSASTTVVDSGSSAEFGEFPEDSPEDWIEDADVPDDAAHEPLQYPREEVTPSDHAPGQSVPDSPQFVPAPLVQRQPDTISAEVTAKPDQESPNAPVVTPPTAAGSPVQHSTASTAATDVLPSAAPSGADEAAADTARVHGARSGEPPAPNDPFTVDRPVGADLPATVAFGAPEAIMRSTDISQSPTPSTVTIDSEVGGAPVREADAVSSEIAHLAASRDAAPDTSTPVQRTSADADAADVGAAAHETLGAVNTVEDPPDAHDVVTATPVSQADVRHPQSAITAQETPAQDADHISVSSDDSSSAATPMPNSPMIAAIQRTSNADTSLASEYVSWDQLPMFDAGLMMQASAAPAPSDEDSWAQSSVADVHSAAGEAAQTEGDVPFTQPAEHASATALPPSTVQRVPSALIDTLETEADSEGIYPTPAAPAPTGDSTSAVTGERPVRAQERSDEPQGTAPITSAGAGVPTINVGTAPRDVGEARASDPIQRVSDVTPASVVPARYVMPQFASPVDQQGEPAAVEAESPALNVTASESVPVRQDLPSGQEGLSQPDITASPTFAADPSAPTHHQSIVQRAAFQSEPSGAAAPDAPENAAADWQEALDEDTDSDAGAFNAAQPDLYQALVAAGAIAPSVPAVQRTPETGVPQAKVPAAHSTEAELLKWLNLPPDTPVTGSLHGDAPVSTAPNVQRALPGANADASPPEQQEENPEVDDAPGGVDVDKLARDVYSVLRNRLRIERERRNNK